MDLSGYVFFDSIYEIGAVAVAKNTDRMAKFVSLLGDEMVFADQREMTNLASKIFEGANLTMNHVGHSITIVHKGLSVGISWTRARITHTLTFNTNDLLTQLDPHAAIKYLLR